MGNQCSHEGQETLWQFQRRDYRLVLIDHGYSNGIRSRINPGQTEDQTLIHIDNEDQDKEKKIRQQMREEAIKRLQQKLGPLLFKEIQERNNNIKELNLSANKITQADMDLFSQKELPHMKILNLENNLIKDKGLEILSRNEYPSLAKANFDDNGITINGIKWIISNTWNLQVSYSLFIVMSVDGGYHLNVGESLPIIKSIIKNNYIEQIDKIIDSGEAKQINAVKLLLVTPLQDQDPQKLAEQSNKLEQKYRQSISNPDKTLYLLMIALKIRICGSLLFTEKQTIKTKVSCQIISTGLLNQRITFYQTFTKLKSFKFSDFINNPKKLKEFHAWYFQYLEKEHGLDTKQIIVEKVVEYEGMIRVFASTSMIKFLDRKSNYFNTIPGQIKEFFESLQLSPNQFDAAGDFDFNGVTPNQQQRGGMPYFQPIKGKRFGIKISKLYDKGNDDWLMMDGNRNQWAIAFHGIYNPAELVPNERKQGEKINKVRSIMNGRQSGEMLRVGPNQVRKNDTCIKTNLIVGEGVYISPYFLTCLLEYTTSASVNYPYHILLECRAKPGSIKIAERTDYWVINERKDVRPYGIILFTDQQYEYFNEFEKGSYDLHKHLYGKQFSKQQWINVYQKRYNDFHQRN